MRQQLDYAFGNVTSLGELLDCRTLHGDYTKAVEGVCQTALYVQVYDIPVKCAWEGWKANLFFFFGQGCHSAELYYVVLAFRFLFLEGKWSKNKWGSTPQR